MRTRTDPRLAARRATALASLGALALSASACVTNPVTGRSELSLMSPAEEAAIGRREAANVEKQIGLVRTPALVDYVRRIGARVAAQSPRKDVTYQFFVADMAEPNAFAIPGGYVYVSRGLLALTNSEAELAGVIGHEIGHVAARHSAQRQTRAMGVGALTMLGAIAGAVLAGPEAGQMIGQLGQVAGAGLIASYGRDQERQADEVGQKMAAASGYDARGISDFLRTLGRETSLRLGKSRMPTFFDSHPGTEERVRDTAERARALPPSGGGPFFPAREEFFAQVDGIMLGPDPAKGVFQDQRFLHPGLDLFLELPAGWQTVNQDAFVGAQAPNGAGRIVMESVGRRGDPAVPAGEFIRQNDLRPAEEGRVRINELRGYRVLAEAQSQSGPVVVDSLWVDHPSGMLSLTAVAAGQEYRNLRGALSRSLGSVRRLTPGERESVEERLLTIARARAGESLGQLSSRSGNVWSIEETAMANGLVASDVLQAGFPVKIAVARPYRSR
jgi:predicted Zn-dependent protease